MCSRNDRIRRKGIFWFFASLSVGRQGGRESREAWEDFLTHLVRRGLDPKAVKLIISDGCPGMIRAIKTIFPYSDHQHCLFHKMSNLRAKCPRSEWPLIKAKIHKIYFALNERDARENARAFIKEYPVCRQAGKIYSQGL